MGARPGFQEIGRRRDPIAELLLNNVRDVLGKDIFKK